MQPLPFFATAARNLETLLAEELRSLGLNDVRETRGGARFGGTLADAYRACLWSRVANRVLLPIARFPADDADTLYAGARAVPWEEHLAASGTFAVRLDGAARESGTRDSVPSRSRTPSPTAIANARAGGRTCARSVPTCRFMPTCTEGRRP